MIAKHGAVPFYRHEACGGAWFGAVPAAYRAPFSWREHTPSVPAALCIRDA